MTMWTILLLAAVAGVGVWWWQRRRAALEKKDADLAGLQVLDLIGCTGAVASDGLDAAGGGRIRLVDKAGEVRLLPARLVDAERSLERGQEVLVIENPRGDGPVTVVPNDLPGLEDLSG
jgi:hypothetical protein